MKMRFLKNGIKREDDDCLIVIRFTYVEKQRINNIGNN